MSTARPSFVRVASPGEKEQVYKLWLTEAERRAEIKARLAAVNAEHRIGRIEARVYVLVVIGAVVASALWPGSWFA